MQYTSNTSHWRIDFGFSGYNPQPSDLQEGVTPTLGFGDQWNQKLA